METIVKNVPTVDTEEVVNLLRELIDIPSVTGREQPIAEFLVNYMRELGLDAHLQEVEPGRANAIALLQGSGDGPALVFNGHLDTGTSGRREDDYAGMDSGQRPTQTSSGWRYEHSVSG